MRTTAGGKMTELEGRVASFRNRQKVTFDCRAAKTASHSHPYCEESFPDGSCRFGTTAGKKKCQGLLELSNRVAVLLKTTGTRAPAWPLQEIVARERELREEEAAELARERQEAARRKVEREAKRRAEEVEAKFLREKQIALAREVWRTTNVAACRFQQPVRE